MFRQGYNLSRGCLVRIEQNNDVQKYLTLEHVIISYDRKSTIQSKTTSIG